MKSSDSRTTPGTKTIEARSGLRVTIVDIGAAIESIIVPLPRGPINAVLSYDELGFYQADPYFLGSTVGPFANRINNGAFRLDGIEHRLQVNEVERGNCLHGGTDGLHKRLFALNCDADRQAVHCATDLPDGAGGFPGNRTVDVIYQLTDDWSLAIEFIVTTDKDTVVNLANHAYFNLGGPIDAHWIRIVSDAYTPVDDAMIPTGERLAVRESEYDLRELQPLGNRRLDHNFVLEDSYEKPNLAAQLRSNETNLQLDVLTTQPAMQVYTGDYLGQPFQPRQGICLEAQGFPDAPNQPGFPSTRLAAGATYRQQTIYRFAQASELPGAPGG